MTDPTNVFAMDDVKFMTGYNVEPVVASETGVSRGDREVLRRRRRSPASTTRGGAAAMQPATGESALGLAPPGRSRRCPDRRPATSRSWTTSRRSAPRRSTRQGEEAPVIKLVNVILMSAISKGASDIHIEPYEKEYRVRYRIDGMLYNMMAPPLKMRDAITSRIKIMAKLDIAEKRLPQDGRIKIRFSDNGASQGHRLPRLVPADAVRREDRHAPARQGQADARHDASSASSRSR